MEQRLADAGERQRLNKAVASFAPPGIEDGRNVSVVLLIHSNLLIFQKCNVKLILNFKCVSMIYVIYDVRFSYPNTLYNCNLDLKYIWLNNNNM